MNVYERASELGLEPTLDGAEGMLDGRRVALAHELAGRQGSTYVARAWLEPPLDLGLDMRERMLGGLGEAPAVTGQPDLDGEFVITGDEPERVSALFTKALRDELAALYRASFDVRVLDSGCRIYGREGFFIVDEAWVERALRGAAKIANLMDESRALLEPAAALGAHASVLRSVASARGLHLTTTPLVLSGDVEGRRLAVSSIRTGKRRHELHARADFEDSLGVGLSIRRQSLLDDVRTLLGGQDIQVGDAPFDQRFLVRAEPERAERVALLLDRETRAALLAIDARAGAVVIDDAGVSVQPIGTDRDPADLAWMVDALVEVSGRISRNLVRGGAEAGPYR